MTSSIFKRGSADSSTSLRFGRNEIFYFQAGIQQIPPLRCASVGMRSSIFKRGFFPVDFAQGQNDKMTNFFHSTGFVNLSLSVCCQSQEVEGLMVVW
jgi:hypothetical protein